MPIFDFICSKCGHKFEALVMGKEQPGCPECGGRKLKKQPSAVARRSKGGGEPGSGGGSKCSGCAGGNCAGCH
ncbi:MAG TPA: zinc ribbon domain-containing protein [Desulfurivibrionaceae bacterium]|nr:zinc ribbon domain-containing protein [Desulfurivibrionaceae bacterium]